MTSKFGRLPSWKSQPGVGGIDRPLRVIASRGSFLQARLRGPDTSADSSHTTRPVSALFATELPLVSTFAGTGPTSEKRISSRGLPIGLQWPIAPHSPQTIEQGRWFQPVGEIFINKGQTNRSILREKKRCWHRQLP
jgi:hypothetical protein